MTDQPTNQQLDEIAARAAHLHEYVAVDVEGAQPDFDKLTGEDVPALLDEVRRLRAELDALEADSARWANVRNLVEKAIDKRWSSVDRFDLEDALGPDASTVPAAGSARLLGCGLCFEEHGEEVHPHPECPVGRAPAVPAVETRR